MQDLIGGARRLGIELSTTQLGQFRIYYRELVKWNERMNLTAISGYEEVQVKHFLDSLTVIPYITAPSEGSELRVLDVGTGAGLPGIPLKLVRPRMNITLLEATTKKVLFLEHVKAMLGLEEVTILNGRSEEIARRSECREKFDVVLSRAVAALPTLLELTLPFCAVGGIFVAQKQTEAKPEIDQAAKAALVLGGRLREVTDVYLPELSGRCFIVYEKISPTPLEYPRRSGLPTKRPIT